MDINTVMTDTPLVQFLDINDISNMIIDNSLNQFTSSNDVIYRDLCEKYLFNTNIEQFKDSSDDDQHLCLKILKKACTMECMSCNEKLLNLSSGSRLPLIECASCHKLSCGNCQRCRCMYCSFCDRNFTQEERNSEDIFDLMSESIDYHDEEDNGYGEDAPLIVSCVFCNIHYHTPCLLEVGAFNLIKCMDCGEDSCYNCFKYMRNICNCMTSNSMSALCDNCAITCAKCGASYCSQCCEVETCKGCSKLFCCGEDEICLCRKCKSYTMCEACCTCQNKKNDSSKQEKQEEVQQVQQK